MSSNFKNLYTSNNPPLQATLMRGSNIESIHKIHAVITDKKGRVLMCAGNPEYKSFIRSALNPFNQYHLLVVELQPKSMMIPNQLL